jgi:hypothetical protein
MRRGGGELLRDRGRKSCGGQKEWLNERID